MKKILLTLLLVLICSCTIQFRNPIIDFSKIKSVVITDFGKFQGSFNENLIEHDYLNDPIIRIINSQEELNNIESFFNKAQALGKNEIDKGISPDNVYELVFSEQHVSKQYFIMFDNSDELVRIVVADRKNETIKKFKVDSKHLREIKYLFMQ